ncbi:hypothetical protein CQW23_00595 [Capsicum baccatum]|uniref:Uncharacterized protein n=1 Tax=Capsicum baccatum TaxID=33114 RepID=A0A2G2XL69_CAPBA|nr:hypothetical protein CQW23_00595 [Capsicum baccatum]
MSNLDCEWPERAFEEEGVRVVVESCASSVQSHMALLWHFWSMVKLDVLSTIDEFQEGSISLVRSIYKIISKVMLGLKINLSKCEIIPVGVVDNIDFLAQVLQCRVGALPTTYLGLRLGQANKDISALIPVIQRTEKSVIGKLERMQRDFLWDVTDGAKNFHLVRWEIVTSPKLPYFEPGVYRKQLRYLTFEVVVWTVYTYPPQTPLGGYVLLLLLLWADIFRWFGISWVISTSVKELMFSWMSGARNRSQKAWNVTPLALISSNLAFWRVDNSVGTFLPSDPTTLQLCGRAYDLRHIFFGFPRDLSDTSKSLETATSSGQYHAVQSERSSTVDTVHRFEGTFRLIWSNQGSGSRKKLSIWRPMIPQGMVYFGDIAVQGYESPNTCIVLHDSDEHYKAPLDFKLMGQIKKQRSVDSISFWMPQPPPGFVSIGCIACKGAPNQSDFGSLRCIRSDMVTGDQFSEQSIWDTSDAKFTKEPFSLWVVGDELGPFIVRSGFKKPPKRLALKLADQDMASGVDDMIVDAEIRTFSAALFDDYGGLMVPLCNVSFSGITFNLHQRSDYLNSNMTFSLAARLYNDKYDSWEPLLEPVDGLLRYQYDVNAPGAASQLRLASTRDLNLNISVSNANTIFQAYASWNNLSHDAVSPTGGSRPIIDIHHRRNYFIIPQNKLGQDIFIRATEIRGLPNIIKMPSGDSKPIKVPVAKNMLDSHLKGSLFEKGNTMATIIIAAAEFQKAEGLSSHEYAVEVRLAPVQGHPCPSLSIQQSARTRGSSSYGSVSADVISVKWNEVFFFKVDSPVCTFCLCKVS